MSEAAFAAVLARAGYLTCPQTDLLPPGMPAAHKAIEVRALRERERERERGGTCRSGTSFTLSHRATSTCRQYQCVCVVV